MSNSTVTGAEDYELTPLFVYGEEIDQLRTATITVAKNALNELQGQLFQWQQKNFAKEDTGPEWMVIGAAEELGEVSHAILKARQKIREHQSGMDEKALEAVADGVADTCIYLMQLCSHLGIDFGKTLFETADVVLARDWKNKKSDGVS